MEGVIIDLHYPSVFEVMELFKVSDIRGCFKKVRAVFNHMQTVRAEKREHEKQFQASQVALRKTNG
jgi:hypothetical protein